MDCEVSEWRVLGIDASPAATGIARPDGSLDTWTNKLKKGEPTAERLKLLHGKAAVLVTDHPIDLAVIEGFNYGLRRFGDVFGIGEAAGVIKLALAHANVPLITVSPAGRAMFATGLGNAAKAVVLADWKRITGVDFGKDDNQADAHVLREMGLHLLGQPTYQLSPERLRALEAVKKNEWNAKTLKAVKERGVLT